MVNRPCCGPSSWDFAATRSKYRTTTLMTKVAKAEKLLLGPDLSTTAMPARHATVSAIRIENLVHFMARFRPLHAAFGTPSAGCKTAVGRSATVGPPMPAVDPKSPVLTDRFRVLNCARCVTVTSYRYRALVTPACDIFPRADVPSAPSHGSNVQVTHQLRGPQHENPRFNIVSRNILRCAGLDRSKPGARLACTTNRGNAWRYRGRDGRLLGSPKPK